MNVFGVTPVKLNLHPELAWLSLEVEALNDTCAKQAMYDTGADPQITFPDQAEANVLNGKTGLFQTLEPSPVLPRRLRSPPLLGHERFLSEPLEPWR